MKKKPVTMPDKKKQMRNVSRKNGFRLLPQWLATRTRGIALLNMSNRVHVHTFFLSDLVLLY